MNLVLLRYGAIAVLACAVVATVLALARSNGESRSLGMRGLKRARARRDSPLFLRLEPALGWLGAQLRPFLSPQLNAALERTLMLSGDFWGLSPEEFLALSLIACLSAGSFGLTYALVLGRGMAYPLIAAALGAVLPHLQLTGLAEERRRRVEQGLPYAIDLLSLSLSAGLDFPGGLKQLVERGSQPDDPLIEELQLILQELQIGKTRRFAVSQFAERVPSTSVREFVSSIVQAEEQGNPLGRVLEIQAEVMRGQRSVRAEESAAKASVKMMLPMVLLFLAVLMLITAPMVLGLSQRFQE